jgi:hypothetical protein
MDEETVQQIVEDLLVSLEPLDTQTAALLQFLKAKGIATDEELAPFLEQAGNASNIRWRATRVRIRSLISSAMKPAETAATGNSPQAPEPAPESSKSESKEDAQQKQSEEKPEAVRRAGDNSGAAAAENSESKRQSQPAKSNEPAGQAAKEDARQNAKPDAGQDAA